MGDRRRRGSRTTLVGEFGNNDEFVFQLRYSF
jgi:hypothetical protein